MKVTVVESNANELITKPESQAETSPMDEVIPINTDDEELGFVEENLDDQEAEQIEELLSFVDVFKKLSSLAGPMAMSFTFSFEVFLAVLMLNYLAANEQESAAATLVSTLMNTICVLAMSPLFAVSIDLSNKLGELDQLEDENQIQEQSEKISSLNPLSLAIATTVSIPSALGLFFSKNILVSLFRQDLLVASAAQEFLRPYSIAVPALMARMSLEQIMFSFGKTKPAMWMGLINLAIGGGLAALLGFGPHIGKLSIPKLGPTGVAIGFIVESFLTALSYGIYVGKSEDTRKFNFFRNMLSRFKNNSRDILSLLKTGGAISFTVALELGMTLAVGIFSGLIDVQAQSAMTYNMQFMYFEFIGLAALSFSTTQEISRLLGAGQPINASRFGRYGLLTTLSYLAPIPILFAVYPNALIGISGGAEEPVKKILSSLVPIMSIGVLIDIVRYNLLQQTRAFNDLIVPNIIAGLGLGSGIALSWALGLQTNLGIDGVGTGYTLGIALTTIPLLIRWVNLLRTTSKPKSVIIEELPEEDNTLSTRVVKALKQLSFLKSNGEKSPLLQPPELQINYH